MEKDEPNKCVENPSRVIRRSYDKAVVFFRLLVIYLQLEQSLRAQIGQEFFHLGQLLTLVISALR